MSQRKSTKATPHAQGAVERPGTQRGPVTRQSGGVTRADRERVLGQTGAVVWLTGLPSSGKTTVAFALETRLVGLGRAAYVLDGDNLRHGLNSDLGFSDADRTENIRRVGEVAALFADAGLIVVASFISPFVADRQRARAAAGDGDFVEVFIDAPLAVCEARDPRGLYRRARAGQLPGFTGIDAPYEPPPAPDLHLRTAELSIDEETQAVLDLLSARGVIAST